MSQPPLANVRKGERFRMPAAFYNQLASIAKHYGRGLTDGDPRDNTPPERETEIKVKAYAALPRYGVVNLGESFVKRSGNATQFQERRVYESAEPNGATWPIAIVQEPAAQAGAIVPAVLLGETIVKVDITDESHNFAEPISGDKEKLTSAASGGISILHKDETGLGEKWCRVVLSAPIGGSITGRSGRLWNGSVQAIVVAGSGWVQLSGGTGPAIPTITATGAYVFNVHFQMRRNTVVANGPWSVYTTLDDPGDGVEIFGPGYFDGVIGPRYDTFTGEGKGARIADWTQLYSVGSTTDAIASVTWFLNVLEVPYTPKIMVQVDVGGGAVSVEFRTVEDADVPGMYHGSCYSLVRLPSGGGVLASFDGAGSVPGGGTGQTFFPPGELLTGNGSGGLTSSNAIDAGEF